MNNKTKTIGERIAEHESRNYGNDIHRLVNLLREALKEHGIEKYDTYTVAKAATALLLDAHNAGSERDSIPGMVAAIRSTHRYLQGKGIFAVLTALGHLPGLPCATDARNEHAYKACEELRTALRERIYWPES